MVVNIKVESQHLNPKVMLHFKANKGLNNRKYLTVEKPYSKKKDAETQQRDNYCYVCLAAEC